MKPKYFNTLQEALAHVAKMQAAGFRTLLTPYGAQFRVDVWSKDGVYAK